MSEFSNVFLFCLQMEGNETKYQFVKHSWLHKDWTGKKNRVKIPFSVKWHYMLFTYIVYKTAVIEAPSTFDGTRCNIADRLEI